MTYKQLMIVAVCCSVTSLLFSQTTVNDTLIASRYYQKGDSLLTHKEYEKSIEFFKKALPTYEKIKAWEKVTDCYNKISINKFNINGLDQSFLFAEKAMRISEKYLDKNSRYRADAYFNLGKYYYEKTNGNAAIENYQKALKYLLKSNKIREKSNFIDQKKLSESYKLIGDIYDSQLSKFDLAMQYYNKALQINTKEYGKDHLNTLDIYNRIALVFRHQGKLEEATYFQEKNLEINLKKFGEQSQDVSYGYVNLGVIYSKLMQYDIALNYFHKALPYFKKNEEYNLPAIYLNIGAALLDKGSYDEALQYNEKCLSLSQESFGKYHRFTVGIYQNISRILISKNELENALVYAKNALEISESIFDKNSIPVGKIYLNIGEIYKLKKEYDNGLKYYTKATNIFKKNSPEIAALYESIAELYFETLSYTNAIAYYTKALKIYQNRYGADHLLTSTCYIGLGKTYDKLKNYEKAIFYYNRSIVTNTKNKNRNHTVPHYYYNDQTAFETLREKAFTFQSLYQNTNDKKHLDQSIAIYQSLTTLISQIRKSYQNNNDKLAFAREIKDIYTDAIKTQLLHYKYTQSSKDLEKIFYYTEKSRANSLKELLNEEEAKKFSEIPDTLLKKEQTLKTSRAFYKSQLTSELSNKKIDSVKLSLYENELFTINRKQDSITEILEKDYPKYHQLKYQNQMIAVSEIQQRLDNQTTLVEFFTTDSTTYAFTISKNSLIVKELATPQLKEKIQSLQKAIVSENDPDYRALAHSLYQELIAPIKDQLIGDQLIIIPDGPLWHLNFDILLTQEEKQSNNFKEAHYLLKQYAISYANSATLLFQKAKNSAKEPIKNECLAFSFSDTTQIGKTENVSLATLRDAGDDLPGSRQEIKVISNIINGQYYFGKQAIESNFKKNAKFYNILHLALHGEVDNENPENSKLYFTKTKDTLEDNLLYSHELFALDIPAELTVLSACNTGSGSIAKGEGIMSLGNAFQYAGTKSLLLSRWEVSDKTTPKFMQNFYTNLKSGMNKAKALQQAKLQYLNANDAFYNHPFYWSSFYLIGDTSAISFKDSTPATYWIFIIGLIILASAIVYFKKKTSA